MSEKNFEDLRCNSVMDVKLQLWQMILSNVLSRISKSSTFSNNFLVSVSFKMKNAPFVFVNYTWKLCMANLVWQLSLWNNEWVISWFTKRFIFFVLKFFRVFLSDHWFWRDFLCKEPRIGFLSIYKIRDLILYDRLAEDFLWF